MTVPQGAPLRLYNTFTREVAAFTGLRPPHVGMYTCGPTVYAYAHIGNMRAYVFADTLRRALEWKGYRVRQVMNITDVGHLTSDADEGGDKLELAARTERRSIWDIADHYTSAFRADIARLRILEPNVWCKATDHVGEMIGFAERLERTGLCYRLPTGLYFDTAKLDDYGRLARLDLQGLREGARVEAVAGRRNPPDFAVWRTTPPGEARQMEWDSPWGRGTPGWHLECSVLSMKYLGSHFDIHTGGVDHVPVHHVNEIAQSEAYLGDGQQWVRWWLHGEFINLEAAKISKSRGGGLLVSDLRDRGYHPSVYRYLLLQAHYRSQTEFDWHALDAARAGLRRILERIGKIAPVGPATGRPTYEWAAHELSMPARSHLDALDTAACDDLNTAKAVAALSATARDESLSPRDVAVLIGGYEAVLGLGLGELAPTDLDVKRSDIEVSASEVDALVALRNEARAARDFARADELRERLATMGVAVEDKPDGPSSWRWA